tara:strand:+ start:297 stop:560 length:264 start_codon:yes stop_codon:yes gene_type:complete
MIDIIIGFGVVIFLIPVSKIISILIKKFPSDASSIGYTMLVFDLVVCVAYLYAVQPMAINDRMLVGGMGIGIIYAMIHKILIFLKLK